MLSPLCKKRNPERISAKNKCGSRICSLAVSDWIPGRESADQPALAQASVLPKGWMTKEQTTGA